MKNINMALCEVVTALSEARVPDVDSLIDFREAIIEKSLVENIHEFEYLIPTKLLKTCASIYQKVGGEDEFDEIIRDTLCLIDKHVGAVNVNFMHLYFKASKVYFDKDSTVEDRIRALEISKNENPKLNVYFEAELLDRLVTLYLEDPAMYFEEIKEIKDEFRKVITERDRIPLSILG